MPTTHDMMMNLKEMFGDQTCSARQKIMKDPMNITMAETTLVRDPILKMISLLNELEILGAEIDGESQVDIILQSLPNSYKQFCLNYNMNNTNVLPCKRKEPSQMNQTYLWHLGLGHINLKRISILVQNGPLGSLELEALPVCESYLEGKMTRRAFIAKGYRAKEQLELVHSDLCGPMTIQARGGFEYFIIFIDDYSRYGYIYLIRRKSEAFEKFKEYRAETEKRLNKCLKTLRFDHGGEYLLGEFRDYLSEQGITSQLSAPGVPQQNGVAKRRNKTLMNMVRLMMSYSDLPNSFWGYALETAAYILNLVPSKSVPTTPI